jgi:hypothetical protein
VVSSNSPPWPARAGVCHLWSEKGWGVAVHKAHKSTPSKDFLVWMYMHIISDKVLILVELYLPVPAIIQFC